MLRLDVVVEEVSDTAVSSWLRWMAREKRFQKVISLTVDISIDVGVERMFMPSSFLTAQRNT